MSTSIQAIRGMHDILPAEADLWEQFETTVRDWLRTYAYLPIRMPLVEPTPLFSRAIGEVTDIVEKEMYSFLDREGGEHLTLRPEGTASCTCRVATQFALRWAKASVVHGADVSPRAATKRSHTPISSSRC